MTRLLQSVVMQNGDVSRNVTYKLAISCASCARIDNLVYVTQTRQARQDFDVRNVNTSDVTAQSLSRRVYVRRDRIIACVMG